jgi:hypothetical protein
MKVIYNLENIPNKEFQHCVESKWIEVMNMKMQMIQSVSIVNLIQTKLNGLDDRALKLHSPKIQSIQESKLGQRKKYHSRSDQASRLNPIAQEFGGDKILQICISHCLSRLLRVRRLRLPIVLGSRFLTQSSSFLPT